MGGRGSGGGRAVQGGRGGLRAGGGRGGTGGRGSGGGRAGAGWGATGSPLVQTALRQGGTPPLRQSKGSASKWLVILTYPKFPRQFGLAPCPPVRGRPRVPPSGGKTLKLSPPWWVLLPKYGQFPGQGVPSFPVAPKVVLIASRWGIRHFIPYLLESAYDLPCPNSPYMTHTPDTQTNTTTHRQIDTHTHTHTHTYILHTYVHTSYYFGV